MKGLLDVDRKTVNWFEKLWRIWQKDDYDMIIAQWYRRQIKWHETETNAQTGKASKSSILQYFLKWVAEREPAGQNGILKFFVERYESLKWYDN